MCRVSPRFLPMAKLWAKAKTCSASLVSAAWRFVMWLFGGLARWAAGLHFVSALAAVAGQAVASHPLGESLARQLPEPARSLIGRNEELQRTLVLPWVLLGSAAASLWTACAILSLGRHAGRHAGRYLGSIMRCKGCKSCRRRTKAVATKHKEEKDNGPPKMVSSGQGSSGQHLRRRTYPKVI